jgi:hypothetical protein
MPLTTHQEEKASEILNHLHNKVPRILLLGSAGTGKTYLVGELMRRFKRDFSINPLYNNGKMYALAPTHKALSILMTKITTPVEFKTSHSAVKMIMGQPDRITGLRKFIRAKQTSYNREDDFKHCKIAINDECSMINSEIVSYLDEYRFPIIYTGDDKQINPVGEPFSPVFHRNYPIVRLTEIIRQGAGNPIIDLSNDLDMIYFKEPNMINGKGYTYSNAKHVLIDNLAEVNGTDEMKYLAFTNSAVDEMNKLVRQKRYGNPNKIEKDETIVFNSPFGNFYTNQEIKVETVETVTDYILVPSNTTRYDKDNIPISNTDRIKVKYYRINDRINVLHEQSEYIFKKILDGIIFYCSKHGWDWRGKFYFAEQFADIKYNHAITVHKSQGSTYKEAILNIGDILICRDINERTRLLYTGITRASDVVILNNVK